MKRRLPLPALSDNALKSAAAIALMCTAAGGVWRYAPELRDVAASVRESVAASTTEQLPTAQAVASRAGVIEQGPAASATHVPAAAVATDSAAFGIPQTDADALGADNEIRWEPAVARTWVNVRSDASRGGEVVGVIKPASRAMLGTDRAGWRQVRYSDVSGWVDPRLFEADSLRTSGE